jgi:hypothetical protein
MSVIGPTIAHAVSQRTIEAEAPTKVFDALDDFSLKVAPVAGSPVLANATAQ